LKYDLSFSLGKQGVIMSQTNIGSGMKFRSALSDQDIACQDGFATIFLYTQSFGF
jgi:ADP-glucose pyrophosphorylase